MKHAEVAKIAAQQYGLITRDQLARVGVGNAALSRRVASGLLERVQRAVYRIPGATPTWHQHVLAACLASGGVASQRSAAALWEIADQPATVDVTVPFGCKRRAAGAVTHRSRSLTQADRTTVGPIPVTSLSRTLIDIAGSCHPASVERMLDEALRGGRLSLRKVAERLAAWPNAPGRTLLLDLLADRRSRGATGSALEVRFVRLLRGSPLPPPVRQHRVTSGRRVAIIDFAYPALKVAIEVDGYRFHGGRADWERDLTRQNMLVGLGWTVLRFTSTDLDEPSTVIERVSAVLSRRVG